MLKIIFLVFVCVSFEANASVILSPISVIDAPNTIVTGFSFDRTIDQSGLTTQFISGETDFDAYIGLDPTHVSTNSPQTHAVTGHTPNPFLNIDYDLGGNYLIESLAFWNYAWPDSAGITSFNIFTSDTTDFNLLTEVGSFNPQLDGNRITRINFAQVFDLDDTSARYVRFQIASVDNDNVGSGFSEIAFGVTPVPLPSAIWLFFSGLLALVGFFKKNS